MCKENQLTKKTITMKIKNLFYLLLALPLVFAACEKTPEPTPNQKEAVLTLTSDAVLNFGAEGGEAEITYNLQNPVEGLSSQWLARLIG